MALRAIRKRYLQVFTLTPKIVTAARRCKKEYTCSSAAGESAAGKGVRGRVLTAVWAKFACLAFFNGRAAMS
jgi:hypothetical protein